MILEIQSFGGTKNNVLKYKGYYTEVKFSAEDKVLYGKIEGIKDLVNFESKSADEVEKEFHRTVEDYLEFCKESWKEPDKVRNIYGIDESVEKEIDEFVEYISDMVNRGKIKINDGMCLCSGYCCCLATRGLITRQAADRKMIEVLNRLS